MECLTSKELEGKFLHAGSHRLLVHTLAVQHAKSRPETETIRGITCEECGEDTAQYLDGIAMRMTNILLNNYTKERNAKKKTPTNKPNRQTKKYEGASTGLLAAHAADHTAPAPATTWRLCSRRRTSTFSRF
eukprot:comp22509_c0_seq1/m.34104 comp22509_c0_seq1/g.34104  ORF comp22509_c0_seq1/g.34104 comp22509_c0_seq1/m.34104 type:complete len:132 (+) comp22509_c0_seq1:542-937(+)